MKRLTINNNQPKTLFYSIGSGQHRYQTGKKYFKFQNLANVKYKKNIYINFDHLLCVRVYFIDQNIVQKEYHVEFNFEGLEIQKRNVSTDRAERVDEKK